jgi:hypothetical protein
MMMKMMKQCFAQLHHLSDQLRFTIHRIFNFQGFPKNNQGPEFSNNVALRHNWIRELHNVLSIDYSYVTLPYELAISAKSKLLFYPT